MMRKEQMRWPAATQGWRADAGNVEVVGSFRDVCRHVKPGSNQSSPSLSNLSGIPGLVGMITEDKRLRSKAKVLIPMRLQTRTQYLCCQHVDSRPRGANILQVTHQRQPSLEHLECFHTQAANKAPSVS